MHGSNESSTEGEVDGTIVQLPSDADLAGDTHGGSDLCDEDAPVPLDGYALGELLGKGGMGEVMMARDQRIGRDVAVKRMRTGRTSTEAERRFLREAKLQARLQHPAIVPVHELGRDAAGRPYFTMKRLAGVTLQQLLTGTPSQHQRQRLLRALADVCLAIEFAHEHGVIHRDIKPANIMLGDFGEVYILDWGVARVIDDAATSPSVIDIMSPDGETRVGAVMGTPGYMAPEQALGHDVTQALDVYALGCVLFEILAGEALHPRGTAGAANAVAHPTEAPSARRPERMIPPELDAACVAALAEEPEDRPSARQLARRIQDYLDGDRDLERRRELAQAQVAEAKALLASGDPARRAEAVHAAGRALALDPELADAANLVSHLIVEPPAALPPSLIGSLADAERAASRVRARTAIFAFAAVLVSAAALPFVEVRSWGWVIGCFAAMLGVVGSSWLSLRRGGQVAWISMIATFAVAVFAARIASPFVVTPVMICGMVLGLTAIPSLLARPWLVRAWIAASVIAPIALEASGLVERTWWFDGDTLRIRSAVFGGTGGPLAALALIAAQIGFVSAAAMFVRVISRDRRAAEHQLHVQAWHLRQLLPERTAPP